MTSNCGRVIGQDVELLQLANFGDRQQARAVARFLVGTHEQYEKQKNEYLKGVNKPCQ
jgi:hypothetical protein